MSNPFVWRLAQGITTTVKVQKIRVEVYSVLNWIDRDKIEKEYCHAVCDRC
jgi:hypothetical protein